MRLDFIKGEKITQDHIDMINTLGKEYITKTKIKDLFDKYNMKIHHPILYKELELE